MAYVLKSSGLATSCILAVVVDDDGATVKDIKTGTTGTRENNGGTQPSIATGTWNGTARKYISIPGSTNNALDFGAGALSQWLWETATSKELTVIALVDDYAAGAGGARTRLVGSGDGNFYIGRGQYGDATLNVYTTGGAYNLGSPSVTDRQAICFVLSQGQTGPAYLSVDGANVGSNVAASGPLGSGAFTPRYIGRDTFSNNSSMNAKLYGLFVFTGELTTAQMNAVVADPWTELFDAGGAVTLTVADATHGHAVDNATLSAGLTLSVADAAHAHLVDNLALLQAYVLSVADATHGHAADNVTLQSRQFSFTLYDTDGTTPMASRTGLWWAWWSSVANVRTSLPDATGTGASTDASGVFTVDAPTALSAGTDQGFGIISDQDATADTTEAAYVGSFDVI